MGTTQQTSILKKWSCIRISGSGAEKLLQGQLTCDVAKLASLQPQLGAYCNLQGKVVVSFYLVKQPLPSEFVYWMILAKDLQQITLATLKKYAVFFEVDLSVGDQVIAGVWDEGLGSTQPGTPQSGSPQKDASADLITLPLAHDATRRLLITQSTDTGSDDDQSWRLADIQQGIIHIDAVLTEKYLPNALNYHLNGAVDFKKGCYRGQEIVARVYYRGQLKHRLAEASAGLAATQWVQQIGNEGHHYEVLSQVNREGEWHGLVLLPSDLALSTTLYCIDQSSPTQQLTTASWRFCGSASPTIS